MTGPLVSVILPVYNGAGLVRQAVDSILAQTFRDFELIVIDDGSRDDSAAVVAAVDDPRLRLVRQENQGLPAALNHGIGIAQGRYLARQDHDDLSRPTRLEKQVAFLESRPDVALVGTRAEIWMDGRPTGRVHDHPSDDPALRFELLFDNPFVHSSVMLRKAAVDEVGGYLADTVEDYDLWSRLARRHRVANLAERLVIYCEMPNSITRTHDLRSWQEKVIRISARNLAIAIGESEPSTTTVQVATLHQRAFDMLPARLNLSEMESVIKTAARRFLADAPHSDISRRCTRHLWLQRLWWLFHRYPWTGKCYRKIRSGMNS